VDVEWNIRSVGSVACAVVKIDLVGNHKIANERRRVGGVNDGMVGVPELAGGVLDDDARSNVDGHSVAVF
jgi:hypothetical protein